MFDFNLVEGGDSNVIGPTPSVAWTTWVPRVLAEVEAAFPADTISNVNNALGSTASYDVLNTFATKIGDESPTVLVIQIGTNNPYYNNGPGYPRGDGQDYSPTGWRTHIQTVVEDALELTDPNGAQTRVVLCSPPPAHAESYPGSGSWRDPVQLEAIRDQAEDLASDLGERVTFVDLWTEMQTNPSWETVYIDTADGGVHMSDAGQQACADLIAPAVIAAVQATRDELTSPAVASSAATDVTTTSATITGTVDPNTIATTYRVEYGEATSYGQTTAWQSAGSGGTPVSVEVPLAGLAPGTTYHARIVATSAAGTTNGADITFTTDPPDVGLTLDASPVWTQTGTAITARALAGRRSTVPAVAYSENGGPIWGDGADADRFDIDGESIVGESAIVLEPGVPLNVELGVTPQDDDEALTIRIGVPL